MARPEAWRLDRDAYPFGAEIQTRWADLDMLGHINNVAMAGLIEEGRGAFSRSLHLPREKGARSLIASIKIDYLAEAFHLKPLTVATGVERVGTRSWTILSGVFQSDRCVATCDSVLVYALGSASEPLPEAWRTKLEAQRIGAPGR